MTFLTRHSWAVLALASCLVHPTGVMAEDVIRLEVDTGDSDRDNVPVRFEISRGLIRSPELLEALGKGPVRLGASGDVSEIQLDQRDKGQDDPLRLTFILMGRVPAHTKKVVSIDCTHVKAALASWSLAEREPGVFELKNRERTVFRYNATPIRHPNYGPIQYRDAYIHPAFTPTGQLITGDYSKFHPHHRGFFLAYAHAQVGDLHPDFWNIHSGTGKIYAEGVTDRSVGPVVARLTTKHRWEAKGGKPVLSESWDIEAFDIPNQPYWLFDLTSTQQAIGDPVEVQPYHYGGMAYRGADPFVEGGIDVMTSDGAGRVDRDQKLARWVDLTGPVTEGSSEYGGAMIADHPSNVNHPTVARIHPITLPFFSYVPAYKTPFTIAKERPTVFRYRVLIHDGRPDRELDERVWRDFVSPPRVTLLSL